MRPIKPKNTVVEREGVNFVRTVVEDANCIFQEIELRNDYGNDAIIELVEGEEVRGICIAAQIKSGKSYVSPTSCRIPATRAHFEYWAGHSLPVVGIVYDPDDSRAYWFNLSNYLKANRQIVTQGPFTVSFKKREVNRFDKNGIKDFFLPTFLKRPVSLDYERSIRFAKSSSTTEHRLGLRSLLAAHRHREDVWDFLLDILRNRDISETSGYLIYILSLIPGHGDIFWHSGNIIPKDLQPILRAKLAQLTCEDVVRIIHFVDENGFQRGSLGQCVDAIVSIVDKKEAILRQILADDTLPHEVRKDALTLMAFYKQRSLLPFLDKMLSQNDELAEFAHEIKEHLETHGFLYIY